MPADPRPWYKSAEWIALAVTLLASVLGGASAIAHGDAQTAENSRDIQALKLQIATVPERLARIEQKVDDLKTIEVRRDGRRGD